MVLGHVDDQAYLVLRDEVHDVVVASLVGLGIGNGTSSQYSCLENSMDRGA